MGPPMDLVIASLLVWTATSAELAAPAPRTLTSTTYGGITYGLKPVKAVGERPRWRTRKKAIEVPEPPRDWGGEQFWLGFGLESSLFRSRVLAEDMSITPQQEEVPNALVREAVLLFGITGAGEARPLPWLGLVGMLGYYFTPRFFSISVETDGAVETKLSFAHGGQATGLVRAYLRVNQRFDLFLGAGPLLTVAHFRDRVSVGFGALGQAGFVLSTRGFPEARLAGFLRYAPTGDGDELDLDLTGAGLMADVAFGLF